MKGFSNFQTYEGQTVIVTQDNLGSVILKDNMTLAFEGDIVIDKLWKIENVQNITLVARYGYIQLNKKAGICFKNCTNIRVSNLYVLGPLQPDKEGGISLQFNNCQHIQIDDCTFIDGEDEQISIKNGSDYVTINHCKFLHNTNAYHAYSILIGKNIDDRPESGIFHVTINQCYFKGGSGRHPRFRNAIVHVIDCIWDSCVDHLIGAENGTLFIGRTTTLGCEFTIYPFGDYRVRFVDRRPWPERYVDNTIPEPVYE